MSTDPADRTRSRTLSSRSNLEKDMELLRRYSSRYLPQPATSGTYRPGQSSNYARAGAVNTSNGTGASKSISGGGGMSQSPQNSGQQGNVANGRGWDSTNGNGNSNEEMSDAMRSMVDSMQSRANEQSRMLSEMEERILKDSSFGKTENADKWTTLEVCYWLNTIHLHKYVHNFSNLSIDGSILLNDLDETMLATELGIKKIHLKKCLREIAKLKEAVQSRGKSTKQGDTNRRIEELERQAASLEQINSKLKEQFQLLTERTKPKTSPSPSMQDLSLQNNTKSDDSSKSSTQINDNTSSQND